MGRDKKIEYYWARVIIRVLDAAAGIYRQFFSWTPLYLRGLV